jgi:hypothetical protein
MDADTIIGKLLRLQCALEAAVIKIDKQCALIMDGRRIDCLDPSFVSLEQDLGRANAVFTELCAEHQRKTAEWEQRQSQKEQPKNAIIPKHPTIWAPQINYPAKDFSHE